MFSDIASDDSVYIYRKLRYLTTKLRLQVYVYSTRDGQDTVLVLYGKTKMDAIGLLYTRGLHRPVDPLSHGIVYIIWYSPA